MYTTSLHFTRERKSKADTCEKKAWATWLERFSFSNSSSNHNATFGSMRGELISMHHHTCLLASSSYSSHSGTAWKQQSDLGYGAFSG